MKPVDTQRIAVLAQALRISPQQMIVACARLARDGDSVDLQRRREVLAAARVAGAAADNTAALLLTPSASFAQDELDLALTSIWPTPRMMGN